MGEEHLLHARRADSDRKRARVLTVIDGLEPGGSLAIAELARRAGVHRSFLYRHHDLYEQAIATPLLKRIASVKAERDVLEAENKRLRAVADAAREAFTYITERDDLAEQNPAVFGGQAYKRKRDQAKMALDQLDGTPTGEGT